MYTYIYTHIYTHIYNMPKSVFFFLTGRALPTQRRCAVRSARRGALPLPQLPASPTPPLPLTPLGFLKGLRPWVVVDTPAKGD